MGYSCKRCGGEGGGGGGVGLEGRSGAGTGVGGPQELLPAGECTAHKI